MRSVLKKSLLMEIISKRGVLWRNIFGSTLLFMTLMLVNSCGMEPEDTQEMSATEITESIFDEELATKLGADDYGMKRYVMAFLKAGPNRDQDPLVAQEIQAGHMAHITLMAEQGKLVLAGPFLDGGEIRGIFVFDATMEEAEALTAADPAVQSGRLEMELHSWYGSAALMQVNEIHRTLAKTNP